MDVTDGPIRSANFVLEPIPWSLPLSPSSPLLGWDRLCLPVRSRRARSSENVQKQRCRSIRGGVSSRSVPENGIIQSVFERLSVCRNPDCRKRKSARDCLTYFWYDRFLFLKFGSVTPSFKKTEFWVKRINWFIYLDRYIVYSTDWWTQKNHPCNLIKSKKKKGE